MSEQRMTQAARSIFIFSWYLLLTGPLLLVFADTFLVLAGMSTVAEYWLRIFGLIVIALGYYYRTAALNNYTEFFRASVHGRMLVFIGLVILALFGLVPVIVAVFGVVDAMAAFHTAHGLRADSE